METMKNSPNLSQININSHTEGLLIIVAIAQYNMPSVQEKNYMTNSKANTSKERKQLSHLEHSKQYTLVVSIINGRDHNVENPAHRSISLDKHW